MRTQSILVLADLPISTLEDLDIEAGLIAEVPKEQAVTELILLYARTFVVSVP